VPKSDISLPHIIKSCAILLHLTHCPVYNGHVQVFHPHNQPTHHIPTPTRLGQGASWTHFDLILLRLTDGCVSTRLDAPSAGGHTMTHFPGCRARLAHCQPTAMTQHNTRQGLSQFFSCPALMSVLFITRTKREGLRAARSKSRYIFGFKTATSLTITIRLSLPTSSLPQPLPHATTLLCTLCYPI
jgi:hypothetical protein